ncbi:MAG: hypothetical protein ABI791_13850 [Acidobacteriota bacterium]
MSSKLLITLLCSTVAVASACSTATPSANTNTASNSNVTVTIDAKDLPPGFSTSPLPTSANSTPGIPPANQVAVEPKGTPTPGIPDSKTMSKPFKPGATPTPGIPDAATLRRQMSQPAANVNAPSVPGSEIQMMKGKKRPVTDGTPQ